MFIPLRKVDEKTRRVYASVDETPDHAREAMDYGLARPQFEKWSGAQEKASAGKSYGNVREMHTKSAVGAVVSPLQFDDLAKTIGFEIEVVDDVAWQKVCKGVYTGVSPGGGYGKTYRAGGLRHYEPLVAELSLVDKPCIPTATFQFAKADGTIENREFDLAAFEPANEDVKAHALELAKAAGKPDRQHDFVVRARADLIKRQADTFEELVDGPEACLALFKTVHPTVPDAEARAAAATVFADEGVMSLEAGTALAKAWKAPAADGDDPIAALEKATAEADELTKAAKKPYGDVEYADPKDGKYPIDTPAHIRAAWSYVNMEKNASKLDNPDAVKAKIVAAWKAKIDAGGPPSMEKAAFIGALLKSGAAGLLLKAIGQVSLEKGFYTVGRTAKLLDHMAEIAQGVIWEEAWEQDADSRLPQGILDLMASTRSFLIDMVNEETAEFFVQAEKDGGDCIALLAPCLDVDGMEMSVRVGELQKLHAADTELLQKVGAKISSANMKHVQAMHDHSQAMGAKCDSGNCEKSVGTQELEKFAGAQDELVRARRTIVAAVPQIQALTKRAKEQDAQIAELSEKLEKLAKGPGLAKGVLYAVSKDQDDRNQGGAALQTGEPDPSGPAPDDFAGRRRWALAKLGGSVPAPGGEHFY